MPCRQRLSRMLLQIVSTRNSIEHQKHGRLGPLEDESPHGLLARRLLSLVVDRALPCPLKHLVLERDRYRLSARRMTVTRVRRSSSATFVAVVKVTDFRNLDDCADRLLVNPVNPSAVTSEGDNSKNRSEVSDAEIPH